MGLSIFETTKEEKSKTDIFFFPPPSSSSAVNQPIPTVPTAVAVVVRWHEGWLGGRSFTFDFSAVTSEGGKTALWCLGCGEGTEKTQFYPIFWVFFR